MPAPYPPPHRTLRPPARGPPRGRSVGRASIPRGQTAASPATLEPGCGSTSELCGRPPSRPASLARPPAALARHVFPSCCASRSSDRTHCTTIPGGDPQEATLTQKGYCELPIDDCELKAWTRVRCRREHFSSASLSYAWHRPFPRRRKRRPSSDRSCDPPRPLAPTTARHVAPNQRPISHSS